MTKPPQTGSALIANASPLARRGAQSVLRCTVKHRNVVQRARISDRSAAGQFGFVVSSFVSHKGAALLPPHSYQQTQIGSVRTLPVWGGLV